MKIKNVEFKLNCIIEVVYIKNGLQRIRMGRYFTHDKKRIYLDISENFTELEIIEKINIKDIQSVRLVTCNFWR